MNNISEIGYYDGCIFVSLWSSVCDVNTYICENLASAGHDLFVRVCDSASETSEMPLSPAQAHNLIDALS